jgi:predicted DCC family thiol-disulfide oxidoreductase YuxK
MPETEKLQAPLQGWLLYDAECGFCSRWVNSWASTLRRHGFDPAPLQEPWVNAKLQLPPESLLTDVRLFTPAGQVISGAAVYIYIARHIWWAWPFYAISRLPGLKQLIPVAYRWFAGNRYCISHACKLRPR